jgi:hypothetical protein
MTEQDWQSGTNAAQMLATLSEKLTDRKQRMCAVAWAMWIVNHTDYTPRMKHYADWLAAANWLPQLIAAEEYADRKIRAHELRKIRRPSGGPYNIMLDSTRVSQFSIQTVHESLIWFRGEFQAPPDQLICDVIRDIFGNPFDPVATDPAWLTPTVVSLAQAIYDERAFDRLPILADALEDAGCNHEEILNHCRQPEEHVRGCWAVDLLLDKV